MNGNTNGPSRSPRQHQGAAPRRHGMLLVALLTLLAALLSACDGVALQTDPAVREAPRVEAPRRATATPTPRPARQRTPTPRPQPSRPATGASGLPLISASQLPPEALETIALIQEGGPFPYDKDGATFNNREGLLPSQPRGYYAEYTVITPGEDDRGARRIVAGDDGDLYYTDDHYASFVEVADD